MSRSIKILVLADGNSIHTQKWILGLSLEEEMEIYLLSMNPDGVLEEISNNPKIKRIYKVYSDKNSIFGMNISYLKNVFPIFRIVKSLKPDIINTIYLTSYGFIGAIVKGKIPLVHFLIGTDVMVTPFKNICYRLVTKFALLRGDFFVSVSQSLTNQLETLQRIDENKLLTQQYGVDESVINCKVKKRDYDFVSNRSWIPNSNIPFLLESFSAVAPTNTLALIGGNTAYVQEIQHIASSISGVQHLGILPFMTNIETVARSKFYLSFTSSDGASLSLMEAMAVGSIPVVSDIAPNKEWIKHGKNGFLINLNDLDNTRALFRDIIKISEPQLEEMRKKNREIILRRGRLITNMGRICDRIRDLIY
jgi:L-malate glycosyltransferase